MRHINSLVQRSKAVLQKSIEQPLNEEEQAYVDWQMGDAPLRGEEYDGAYNLLADSPGTPAINAMFWKPLRDLANGDPALDQAYAELPPTKPISCQEENPDGA